MISKTLTENQFELFKGLVVRAESLDVTNNNELKLWLAEDDVVVFCSDGTVFERRGSDGVYNYRDLIDRGV